MTCTRGFLRDDDLVKNAWLLELLVDVRMNVLLLVFCLLLSVGITISTF